MINKIITFSVKNKIIVIALVTALIAYGIYSLQHLPLDAVPDITNNQVQVVTTSPTLAAQEVEQFISYPVEVAMANIPDVIEIRSISRYGLSVVTIVFKESMPMLDARQYVKEQISLAREEIPSGFGSPELMPITTGLGEIYQYVLEVEPGYEKQYSPMKLRTIQDWIVKRQLAGIEGIIEISSFGGYLKQYEVALDPLLLRNFEISVSEVFEALARNNQNSGGSYIEKNTNAYYIRTEGMVQDMEDIENIVVRRYNGMPVLIRDLGEVVLGSPKRLGGMTMDGKGETVGGITLMLKGANSSDAIANVQKRVEEVKKSLPEGVRLYSYLDRSVLIGKAIHTVRNNLLEGGIIVIVVLFILLGDIRGGLIVASIIPLSLLFALILMKQFGISANLMSLGAIDFGIVVDGAVIVVEGVLHTLFTYYAGRELSRRELEGVIINSSSKLFRSAVFGVFIILVVFVPVMTLTGIEGKMFRPMALTLSFTILGALLLSLTYVPMMSALLLPRKIKDHKTFADRIMQFLRKLYKPSLQTALRMPVLVLSLAVALLLGAILLFSRMGSEFIPTLEEGDLAMQMTIPPGSSLKESMRSTTKAEHILLENFPEVQHVVSKIGTAEVPTDPMAIEDADIMIILKDKADWVSARTREELVAQMKDALSVVAGASFEFTQPIQLRFNELMTGAKTDLAIKIFGENTETLKELAERAASLIEGTPGAADIKVDQTEGLPQLLIQYHRHKLAEYGLNIEELNLIIRAAYAGEKAGIVLENERKFDLVVRLNKAQRQELQLEALFVNTPSGATIPLSEVASVTYQEAPMQISREDARRRITIGVNVRNRDIAGLVAEIESTLASGLELPPGYSLSYGGAFENLQRARDRLMIAVPAALALIFLLLYFAFGELRNALIIFTGVPLAAIGGVAALWLRGMPFSISAGIGFIALFGVSVLNGIVLISYIMQLRDEKPEAELREIIIEAGLVRLRPVLMTATVAALGFVPMALSTSNGAEVQKPLATVVIGGLITATLLTLLVLPVLYKLSVRPPKLSGSAALLGLALLCFTPRLSAQDSILTEAQAVSLALQQHPELRQARYLEQIAAMEEDALREIPPTNVQLGYGQFDGPLLDYSVQISQGLGNWAANRVRKDIGAQSQTLARNQTRQREQQIALEVRRAWQAWAYQSARAELIQKQHLWYDSLQQLAADQLRAGAISPLEKQLVDNKALNARNSWRNARAQAATTRLQLEETGFLSCENRQPPTPEALQVPEQAEIAPLFLNEWEIRTRQADLERELSDKLLLPEFSLGYFNQSLRPEVPLQGVLVGMSLPLARKPQLARRNQQRVNLLLQQERLQQRQYELQKQQVALLQTRQSLRQQLDELNRYLEASGRNLLAPAQDQLREGAVTYFQFVQIAETRLETEHLRLETLYRYNLNILELLYLSAQATGQ